MSYSFNEKENRYSVLFKTDNGKIIKIKRNK
jgi:hypothetical protein